MNTIQIKNLRSIQDTGSLSIKPLTVVLGKNSCGKSTLIRFFPLVKQTVEENPKDPILWFGKYVDFGDYETSRPYFDKKSNFSFSVDFSFDKYEYYPFLHEELLNSSDNVKIEGTINVELNNRYVKSYTISFFDQKIEINYARLNNKPNIILNGDLFCGEYASFKFRRSFLPQIFIKTSKGYFGRYEIDHLPLIKKEFPNIDFNEVNGSALEKELFNIQSKDSIRNIIKHNKDLSNCFGFLLRDEHEFNRFNNLILSCFVTQIVESINEYLFNTFSSVMYIKPVRTKGERYYRIQGLNVDNVDSDGTNVPVFMYNMTNKARNDFSIWCKESIGVGFSVDSTKGHISINVDSEDGESSNIIDTGYGYSQILPIMLQIWLISKKQIKQRHTYVVIEQPELHLHPSLQGKLAKVFCSIVNKHGKNVTFIIETHSQTIINEIGASVYSKRLSGSDVNVILAEKKNGRTVFNETSFDEDGFIKNWPAGFLTE